MEGKQITDDPTCKSISKDCHDGQNARLAMTSFVRCIDGSCGRPVGRGLAPAVPFDLHKISVNKINMRFIPNNECIKPMQNGGSKTAPYGSAVAVRLCTALSLSLRDGYNARRGNPYVRFYKSGRL